MDYPAIAHNIYTNQTTVNGHKLTWQEYIEYIHENAQFKGRGFYEQLQAAMVHHWGRKVIGHPVGDPVKDKVKIDGKLREAIVDTTGGKRMLFDDVRDYCQAKINVLEPISFNIKGIFAKPEYYEVFQELVIELGAIDANTGRSLVTKRKAYIKFAILRALKENKHNLLIRQYTDDELLSILNGELGATRQYR